MIVTREESSTKPGGQDRDPGALVDRYRRPQFHGHFGWVFTQPVGLRGGVRPPDGVLTQVWMLPPVQGDRRRSFALNEDSRKLGLSRAGHRRDRVGVGRDGSIDDELTIDPTLEAVLANHLEPVDRKHPTQKLNWSSTDDANAAEVGDEPLEEPDHATKRTRVVGVIHDRGQRTVEVHQHRGPFRTIDQCAHDFEIHAAINQSAGQEPTITMQSASVGEGGGVGIGCTFAPGTNVASAVHTAVLPAFA